MIAATALSLPTALPVIGEQPVTGVEVSGEGADFGALLAQSGAAAIAPADLALTPAASATTTLQLPAALPQSAPSGNILPLQLPVAATVIVVASEAEAPPLEVATIKVPQMEALSPEAPQFVTLPLKALPLKAPAIAAALSHQATPAKAAVTELRLAHKASKEVGKINQHGETEPEVPEMTVGAAPVEISPEDPAQTSLALPSGLAATPVQTTMTLQVPVKPDVDNQRASETSPDQTGAQPVAAAAISQPSQLAEAMRQQPLPAGGKRPSPLTAQQQAQTDTSQKREGPPEQAKFEPTARQLTQVRLEVAPLASRARPAAEDAVAAVQALQIEPDLSAASFTPAVATPPQQAAPITSAAPLTQPHDFGALIDRLAAARDAAAPQAVSISLPHSDFGQVQLRFRHENGALTVSMASNDPDFARVAGQAAPPVLPVPPVGETRQAEPQTGQSASGQSAAGQFAPRGDGAANSSQSQQGQQRGSSAEHRQDGVAHANHGNRGRADDKPGRREGIFA